MQKIFGIGFSKTGTTTLEKAFSILGYKAWHGHWQSPHNFYALALSIHKDYEELFKIINYYDAFSDGPWGGTDLYLEIYRRLPESKFILTIREAESWYDSFERMITKFDPNLETAMDTFHSSERYGTIYFFKSIFGIDTLAGNKQKIIDHYNAYNQYAINFLTKNKADFLVYDIPGGDGWEKLCNFLNKPIPHTAFPHENKAIDIPRTSTIVQSNFPIVVEKQGAIIPSLNVNKGTQKPENLADNQSLLNIFKRYSRHLRDLYLIRTSGLFDKAWYLRNNPDVAQAKVDPLFHYLHNGGFEGRDPGKEFSSKWYLETYEDVKKAGINPLVHFLKHGRMEGRYARPQQNILHKMGKQKIFCIGLNKTGTTSIELALKGFGYILGDQAEAEILMDDWAVRDFRRIIQYCDTADAFQDLPFSVDFTYQILDYAFPGSKFILTVRNNADQWYQSLIRFHSMLMETNGLPTLNDLEKFSYREKGWGWRQQQHIFGVDESNPYNEDLIKMYYTNHNKQVMEYFRFRPKDLLVLNLSHPSAMRSLCEFLKIEYVGQIMPHMNKSKE